MTDREPPSVALLDDMEHELKYVSPLTEEAQVWQRKIAQRKKPMAKKATEKKQEDRPQGRSHTRVQPQTIDKLFAWVGVEEDGGEGVLGMQHPQMGWIMLAGADRDRVESFRPYARDIAQATRRRVYLRLFHAGPVIDEYPGR